MSVSWCATVGIFRPYIRLAERTKCVGKLSDLGDKKLASAHIRTSRATGEELDHENSSPNGNVRRSVTGRLLCRIRTLPGILVAAGLLPLQRPIRLSGRLLLSVARLARHHHDAA